MSPDNEFSMTITKRIAKKLKLDDAQRAKMIVATTSRLATDPPLAPEAEPTSPLDIVLARLGFSRGQRVRRAEASRRLKEQFGEDIETRMAGMQRLAELELLDDDAPAGARRAWTDPRSEMPNGLPKTGADRLLASGEILRDARGEPIVLRSRP